LNYTRRTIPADLYPQTQTRFVKYLPPTC